MRDTIEQSIKYSFFLLLIFAVIGTAPVAAQSDQVTIKISTWWLGIAGLDDHMHRLAEEFMKEHPHINVELMGISWGEYLDRLVLMHVGGVAPDVYFVDQYWIGDIIANGLAANIDPLIERDEVDLSRFRPGPLGAYRAWWDDNALHGLPVFASSYDIYAILDLLINAGLPVPDRHWTTDDLQAYCRRLTRDIDSDGSPDQWCFADAFHVMKTMVYNFGGEYLSEDGRRLVLDSTEALLGGAFPIRLHQETGGLAAGHQAFADGVAAMTATAPAINPTYEYVVLEQPLAERQVKNVLHHGYMINSTTPHLEEAWQFLKWVAAGDGAALWAEHGAVPARLDGELWSIWQESNTNPNVNREQVVPFEGQMERTEPTFTGWLQVLNGWGRVWERSIFGEIDYAIGIQGEIAGWQAILDDFWERVGSGK